MFTLHGIASEPGFGFGGRRGWARPERGGRLAGRGAGRGLVGGLVPAGVVVAHVVWGCVLAIWNFARRGCRVGSAVGAGAAKPACSQ